MSWGIVFGAIALLSLALCGLVIFHLVRSSRYQASVRSSPDTVAAYGRSPRALHFSGGTGTPQETVQLKQLTHSVFEHALEGILVTDSVGTIQAVNPAFGAMMGYPGGELVSRNVRLFKSGRHDAAFYRAMWASITGKGEWRGEVWNRRGDGATALLRLSIAAIRDAGGAAAARYVGIYSDVTEQRRAEEALQRAHAYHHKIVAALGEGLYGVDHDGKLCFLNPAAERMLGWSETDLLGCNAHDLFHSRRADGSELPRQECPLLGVFRDGASYHGEEVFTRRDGSLFPVECHSTPLLEEGVVSGAVVAFTDISRRKEAEQRVHHMAFHDSLTGLANRALLLHHLQFQLAQARRSGACVGVLFMDLNRFKHINDTLGHHVGDAVLQAVAERLNGALREGDLLARHGGDEFIVVLAPNDSGGGCEREEHPVGVARRLAAMLAEPIMVDGREFFVSVSIGISCYPEHGHEADVLLRNADQAMYWAKTAGLPHTVYSTEQAQRLSRSPLLESRLRRAVAQGDLALFVQPVVELATGRIVGGEGLLRWRDGGHLVGPDRFIPLAEETGLIVPMGEWVLDEAGRLLAQWGTARPDFVLAVNLSPRQLLEPSFPRRLCTAIAAAGAERRALELEITETVTMSLPHRAQRTLRWLRQRGVRLSIDDFGTGHSSLLRLREFTADRLKIDRSFVRELPDCAHSAAIVRYTVALAHDLKLTVVAEGVETEGQLRALRQMGCDCAQGFLFSRAVEPEEFTRLLAGGTLGPVGDRPPLPP